ncbi:unnamed protein product [Trichogramma brassicae]|uniref:Uncharacterized protein n=1 Tax=Trichogramma brassicae TaxID=86971 RepID=A0A6H5I290_9HYME|nr:unnamed protein product [Trichogramma brassicae]
MEEDCIEKIFQFKFPTCTTNQEYSLEVPVKIPFQGSIKELVHRLISSFKLPCYVQTDLLSSLESAVKKWTLEYQDRKSEKIINAAKQGELDVEDIIKNWEKIYKQKTAEYAEPIGTTDEELFAVAYHRLVHSPSLEPILQAEHKFGKAVTDIIKMRDKEYDQLTQKQTEEMRVAVETLETGSTEKSINNMAGRHFEEQSLMQGQWCSKIDSLKLEQRRHYRNWIMRLLEEQQTNMLPTPVESPTVPLPLGSGCDGFVIIDEKSLTEYQQLEESFTIHLGSQMKQMHNIRILTGDVLDFCRTKHSDSESADPTPQRLQTALGLYSNDLCGLVLLSDNNLGSYSGTTKELISISQSTSEFHFPSIDEQLEKIREDVKDAIAWRQTHHKEDDLQKELKNNFINSSSSHLENPKHLLKLYKLEIHPAILGLRNILKTACCNDVTTLTIPVLLVHEMTEDMTVAWCTKRAELVFKCVKGFMIEMASWGGAELKNLQFLVPKGMSEEVFGTLATMLPSIFRVSNPLVFKASSTPQTPKK